MDNQTLKDRSFERYLENYRKIAETLGPVNEKWERSIVRERLEEADKILPHSLKLTVQAFIRLLDRNDIKPNLKKSGIKCLQDIWPMVQLDEITPVMGRDLKDWISLLSTTSKPIKEQQFKEKIVESYWRLERVYRKFKVGPNQTEEEEEEKGKMSKDRNISVLTYFVQGGNRSLSREPRFNYDVLMSQSEMLLCLLRQLQSVVQGTHKLTSKERSVIYDHIYMARCCFGFDAMEALKMQHEVENMLYTFRDCMKEKVAPPKEIINKFNQEVQTRMDACKKELKKHHELKMQLCEVMNYMDDWCGQQAIKNWKLPFNRNEESMVDFKILPDCIRNNL